MNIEEDESILDQLIQACEAGNFFGPFRCWCTGSLVRGEYVWRVRRRGESGTKRVRTVLIRTVSDNIKLR